MDTAAKTTKIRLDAELTEETRDKFVALVASSGKSRGEFLAELLKSYEKQSEPVKGIAATLNDDKQKKFFSHMTDSYLKDREYLRPLSESQHTLKGLVESALLASGKSSEKFLEEALIAQSKMVLSLKARKDSITEDPRDEKLRLALVALNQEIQEKGTYTVKRGYEVTPQNSEPSITAIADRAGVNQRYAKTWKANNSKLFLNQDEEVKSNDEGSFDMEANA